MELGFKQRFERQQPQLREEQPEEGFLDKRQNRMENILRLTDDQLEVVKPSLKDFVGRVIKEQPDVIIFLDKSARVFGTPFKKYFASLGLAKMPEIKFFNDDYLKKLYLEGALFEPSAVEKIESILGEFKDKKVFFFDETYSNGKGAAALKMAKSQLGNDDISYFALTRDNAKKKTTEVEGGMLYGIPEVKHQAVLEAIAADPKFTIYNNDISILFSKDAADLYLHEPASSDKMVAVHRRYNKKAKLLKKEPQTGERKKISVPNAADYGDERESEVVNYQSYDTVSKIKQKIFKTLQSLELN